MTDTRQLRIVAGAGEPDDVLALRIDVVKAACELVKAWGCGQAFNTQIDDAERKLELVVHRYKAAMKRRKRVG